MKYFGKSMLRTSELTFEQVLNEISVELGDDHFPLNNRAHHEALSTVIDEHAVHYQLMKKTVLEIARQNGVRYPDHGVSLYATLDALGLVRGQLVRENGDVDQIALIDHMGSIVVALFKAKRPIHLHPQARRSKILSLLDRYNDVAD